VRFLFTHPHRRSTEVDQETVYDLILMTSETTSDDFSTFYTCAVLFGFFSYTLCLCVKGLALRWKGCKWVILVAGLLFVLVTAHLGLSVAQVQMNLHRLRQCSSGQGQLRVNAWYDLTKVRRRV
jgi:hypothetical protein